MTVNIRHLDTAQPDFEAAFHKVLHWSAATDVEIENRVGAILADVRLRGDDAVLEYTGRFDHLQADSVAALELGTAELKA
ncbi:MAG: histidinol dehydrogenase, partial [Aquabacterium sp.]|uniref:histidinol dehydrogenase n=1 Tax=Aquabacterium sp. TaxID=1872578 RepID=UPI0027221CB1